MKKMLLIALFAPLLGVAQMKNVMSAHRVFPKADKITAFEKALAAHAQKYHTGDFKWRVYAIQSGPDAGGFHITEGPLSWEGLDNRGDLGTEHQTDWNNNVAVNLSDRNSSSYSVFVDSLSTVALGDFSDKIQITHWEPKVGYGNKLNAEIQRMKKVFMAGNETVAVYQASGSGPNKYTLVTRYKQGLKERATGFRKPFKERYEAIFGSDSYENIYLNTLRNYTESIYSEMLFLRADLGSK